MHKGSRNLLIGAIIAAALSGAGCATDQAAVETAHSEGDGHQHGASPDSNAIAQTDWCAEHAVPESECTRCNTSLIAGFKERHDWCAGHGLPESHCRLCNPGITFAQEIPLHTEQEEHTEDDIRVTLHFRENAAICATDDALIQLASAQTAQRAGLTVQTARAAQFTSVTEAPAEIVFDESQATVVASTIPALVSRWLIAPGENVHRGAPMALLKSPDMANLKSTLLAERAHFELEQKELERMRSMHQRQLVSDAALDRQVADAEEARVNYLSAEGRLRSAGMSADDIAAINHQGGAVNEFILRAPATGMVIERIARIGELRDAGQAFAALADPAAMWIEARLDERQLNAVAVGQQLVFSSDGHGIQRVGGSIIWVSRFLDPHTRTGTVRARVLDPDHRLQAGVFGRVEIVKSEEQAVVEVPRDAVQWEGCCNVVFVREADTRYRPRKVEIAGSIGPYYQVLRGVRAGEEVVVDGAFLLKTELKKSSIGAGCCGLDPVS